MENGKRSADRNSEGYADHTAGRACRNVYREQVLQQKAETMLHKEIMKNLASFVRKHMELMGYELVWITYRDPETGQEWKKK